MLESCYNWKDSRLYSTIVSVGPRAEKFYNKILSLRPWTHAQVKFFRFWLEIPFLDKFDPKYLNLATNHFHNILRLFDVLPNFPLTTSETICDYHI